MGLRAEPANVKAHADPIVVEQPALRIEQLLIHRAQPAGMPVGVHVQARHVARLAVVYREGIRAVSTLQVHQREQRSRPRQRFLRPQPLLENGDRLLGGHLADIRQH